MSSLDELQRLFLDALATADPSRAARGALFPFLATPPAGLVGDRFDIYRHHYVSRHRRSLALTYPACERLLGTKNFTNLALLYTRERPARERLLDQVGLDLPETIVDFGEHHAALGEWPWLFELAVLERAIERTKYSASALEVDCTYPLDLLWEELLLYPTAEAPVPVEVVAVEPFRLRVSRERGRVCLTRVPKKETLQRQ